MKNYFIFIILFFNLGLFAKQTSYLSFDEPPGWTCQLSQGIYLCESPNEKERQNSLIMIFGAPVTDFDSLANYEAYLNKTKTILDDVGQPIQSKVTFVRQREINGFSWVDSLQKNSELSGFWTRYVATVQKPLAILVTYVVSDEKYVELTPSFEKMVSSLKPVTDFKFASGQKDLALPGTELGGVLKSRFSKKNREQIEQDDKVKIATDGNGKLSNLMMFISLGILGAGYWFWKKRKLKSSDKS